MLLGWMWGDRTNLSNLHTALHRAGPCQREQIFAAGSEASTSPSCANLEIKWSRRGPLPWVNGDFRPWHSVIPGSEQCASASSIMAYAL